MWMLFSLLLFDWQLLKRAARGFFFFSSGKLAVAHAHTRAPTRDVSTPMPLDTTQTKRHKTADTGLVGSSSSKEKRRSARSGRLWKVEEKKVRKEDRKERGKG